MPAQAGAQLPPDPISDDAAMAVEWHQSMMAFEGAGFTSDQSFELVSLRYDAFWRAWYERTIVCDHGCEP